MYQLQQLLKLNLETNTINLEYYRNIRDLTLCMSLLHRFPNLRILSLHGNHLQMLPSMSQLKLTSLDVSNNPLQIDNYLLDSLFSLQSLQSLNIDGSEKDLQRILQNLPNLKMLNRKKIIREKKIDKVSDFSVRLKESLIKQKERIKQLAQKIIQKFEYYDKDIQTAIDTNFKQIFEEYLNFSDNVTIQTAKQGVFLFAKNRLVDLLQQKLINTLSQNGLEHVADSLQEISVIRKQYFDNLLKIVLQVGYNQVCLEDDLGDEINLQMRNIKLRKQRLYLKQIMRLKKKVNDYRTYCNKIEQQNSRYLHNLYSLTSGDYQLAAQRYQIKTSPKQINDFFHPIKSFKQNQKSQTPKNTQSRSNLTPSKSTNKLREVVNTPNKNVERQKQKRQSSNKILLGYDQTLALMQQFIEAKHANNQKAKKKKDIYETAEQFLSNFFTSKYGVKTIAINWSLNFIRSLEFYARQNTLCEVLLKILKHSIEESFYEEHVRFIQEIKKEMLNINSQEISPEEAQKLFLQFFPTEDLDQFKIIINFGILNIQNLRRQLCKMHIKYHQKLISQFATLFKRYDTDGNGVLTVGQAKQFVKQFFKSKIDKSIVANNIAQKISKKLQASKKPKIIFSQLVQLVDRIN